MLDSNVFSKCFQYNLLQFWRCIWCLELSYIQILGHTRGHICKIWISFILIYYTQLQFPQRS
jgi:hypothetical protein